MNAALPATLDYPRRHAAGARRGDRDRAAHRLAAHAAALCARSHQSVAACGRRRDDARRLRFRRFRDARIVGAAFRDDARLEPDPPHHRDALPPRPSGQRRVALAALRGGARRDDRFRVPDRAHGCRRLGRPHDACDRRSVPPPRHGGRGSRGAREQGQPLPARRAGASRVVHPAAGGQHPARRRRPRGA